MNAELKTKILSASSYVMAVANGGLGAFAAKQGWGTLQQRPYDTLSMFFFVALPLLVLLLSAILPVLLRKKNRYMPAFILGVIGVLFYGLWFYAPYTVGVSGL